MLINWQKIFNLIKRTGDRLLVIDNANEEVYAVMDLANYEKLVFGKSEVKDLTEEQLLDKMNRDIAIWRASQPDMEIDEAVEDEEQNESVDNNIEDVEDDRYYIEPVE